LAGFWLGSLLAVVVGVVASIHFTLAGMSLFELLVIWCCWWRAGLFLGSLRPARRGG